MSANTVMSSQIQMKKRKNHRNERKTSPTCQSASTMTATPVSRERAFPTSAPAEVGIVEHRLPERMHPGRVPPWP